MSLVRGGNARALCSALICIGLLGCQFAGGYLVCHSHRTWKGCAEDSHCLPTWKCEKDPSKGGRCEGTCTQYTNSCWINPATAKRDGCMMDPRVGHSNACTATDRDPKRCEQALDDRGHPTCIDRNPPCAGCAFAFASCEAKNNCNGTVCF
jgi:hypothetical protein